MRASEKRYYDRRAAEYDDWWNATGLFAQRHRPGWAEEVAALRALLRALPPAHTLDVGCGTAFLTRELPGSVVALDQSEAMLAIARSRLPDAQVIRADVPPVPFDDGAFERVFTSHVYGHLDEPTRAAFVAEARRVGGELVVADSALRPGADAEAEEERVLSDGSRHSVYKRWFRGPSLAAEL